MSNGSPSPIVSVAGVRGIVGESFTPEVVVRYVSAYAKIIRPGLVIVGGDSRASRDWAELLVAAVLSAHGHQTILVGLAPTPSVGILVRESGATGGVAITASHNPDEYNGLKFFTDKGIFLGPREFEGLKAALDDPTPAKKEYPQPMWLSEGAVELAHRGVLHAVLKPVRGKTRVVIDACNGAASFMAASIAKDYGAEAKVIFDDPSKTFPHEPEPLPHNLKALCAAVKKQKAALGFAIDPDADRLAIVDETGRAIGEERTLVLAADAWLSMAPRKGPLVANLSSSRALEDVAARHGVKVFRSRVGEAHVVGLMREKKAAIGGEGNGGVILPDVHPGRDAATAMALILLGLRARKGMTLSQWNETIPDYHIHKDKVSIEGVTTDAVFAKALARFPNAEADDRDGLKLSWSDRWLHLRASGTEPILRIFAEAPDRKAAEALAGAAKELLK